MVFLRPTARVTNAVPTDAGTVQRLARLLVTVQREPAVRELMRAAGDAALRISGRLGIAASGFVLLTPVLASPHHVCSQVDPFDDDLAADLLLDGLDKPRLDAGLRRALLAVLAEAQGDPMPLRRLRVGPRILQPLR